MTPLQHNLKTVQTLILEACLRKNRDPKQVKLLAVSKTKPYTDVQTLLEAGQTLFGENRVMEARDKIPLIPKEIQNQTIQWHLIGPLQRNKAKLAVSLFQMIHSVDSIKLAESLNQYANPSHPLSILIQVNIGKETQKHGVLPENTLSLVEHLSNLENLSIQGLMTLPPQTQNPNETRSYFQQLASLATEIEQTNIPKVSMKELSMGMSHDYEIAVEEGATLVRVGSKLFGPRQPL